MLSRGDGTPPAWLVAQQSRQKATRWNRIDRSSASELCTGCSQSLQMYVLMDAAFVVGHPPSPKYTPPLPHRSSVAAGGSQPVSLCA